MCYREADQLLAEVSGSSWGLVSASPYETGRLVTLAPWLDNHQERVNFLCRTQHPDGGWGGPEGYSLVPTLSATSALLTELFRGGPRTDHTARAATDGLRALRRWLAPSGGEAIPDTIASGPAIPDTIASELVVPSLIEELNLILDQSASGHRSQPVGMLGPRLPYPDGFDGAILRRIRGGFATGTLSPRLAYSLEALGPQVAGTRLVRPQAGVVGLSPAATAAWLGSGEDAAADSSPEPGQDRGQDRMSAREFLVRLQARRGGPVPVVTPITYFEAAWVLNSLAAAGLSGGQSAALLERLEEGLTPHGAPVAPGLPSDADDTAAVLSALLRHGRAHSPEGLLRFFEDGYFRCYEGERDPSVSTNAHALEALALLLAVPGHRRRLDTVAASTARWLLEVQQPPGFWYDKWHASPYYATAGCVVGLAEYTLAGSASAGAAANPGWAEAIARAAHWVCETERLPGSWGRWQGTVEETSYAVAILCAALDVRAGTAASIAGMPPSARMVEALGRAAEVLSRPLLGEHPPLWHGKDLYTPVRVVRAAHLSARARAGRYRSVVAVPRQRDSAGPDSVRSEPARVPATD